MVAAAEKILNRKSGGLGSLIGATQATEAVEGENFLTGQALTGLDRWGMAFQSISAASGVAAVGLSIAGIDSPLDFTGWFRTAAEESTAADVSGLIFTFRGDSGDISTIFAEAIEAKGTSTDLLAHALDSGAPPSAFVPTSRMFDVAEGLNSEQIFVVRPTGGTDINATLGPLSPFAGENEIAISEWIAPQDIRGVTLP